MEDEETVEEEDCSGKPDFVDVKDALAVEKPTSSLTMDQIMELFEEYLDLRSQETVDEPFVAPLHASRGHPFNETSRQNVINWLFEVSSDAYVQNLVLHQAIMLLDAVGPFLFLDDAPDCKPYHVVQLMAICCVNAMQKIHADFSDLFQQVQKTVSAVYNIEMCEWVEMVVLKIGQPRLRRPSLMGFARIYCEIGPVPRRVGWLMTYLSDLVLINGRGLRRARYCITAAAIYVIAVGTVNQRDHLDMDPWPFDLAKFSRIDFDGKTGDLLMEMMTDIHRVQKDFCVPEQGLLSNEMLKKYRSICCKGVAGYAVMSRSYIADMMDDLKAAAVGRREHVLSVRNEPANLFIRSDNTGPPITPDIERSNSGSKGRYFSNPDNRPVPSKKPRMSGSDSEEF